MSCQATEDVPAPPEDGGTSGKSPVTLLKLISFWGEFESLNLSGAKTIRKKVRQRTQE